MGVLSGERALDDIFGALEEYDLEETGLNTSGSEE